MSSFSNFINTASSILSGALKAMSGTGERCIITLAGGTNQVSFPVAPPNFEIGNPYNNTTVNINNIGDVNMLGKRGLRTLKFGSFFPAQAYNFVQIFSLLSPYDYVSQIRNMAESGQPCKVAISGTDVSMPVSIEEFTYKEQDGTGDVYFSLSLKEYRYIIPASNVTNETTELKGRVADKIGPKQTTCLGGVLSSMDTAQKSIQKTTTIAKQCERTLKLYKAMVKSGSIPPGMILTTTTQMVMANGKPLCKF